MSYELTVEDVRDITYRVILRETIKVIRAAVYQYPPMIKGELHDITWYCFPRRTQ